MATTEITHDGSSGDPAFQVEEHGIDFIPESERWASAKNIAGMWAGSAINVEYFIYGALLMGFGFSFYTALSLIVIGNLSFFFLGLASLQGPETGTTAFTISRAPFGTQGSRFVAFFNWITQLGFETEGLILIVGAAAVLFKLGGITINKPTTVILIILAAGIQALMPYFGHATMVKVLKALIIPFGLIFAVLAYYDIKHGSASFKAAPWGSTWQLYTAGLAFTFALSGLGWTECGNDYTRYVPRDVKKGELVGWLFLATAVPEILMMVLGALTFTFLSSSAQFAAWNSANPFEALVGQHLIPSWFVAIFLVFAIVQLFGINSLDLYSSGVSLQAVGLKLKRYQAVVLDSVIACLLTIYATFQSTFSLILRKFRYNAAELQRRDAQSIYFVGRSGVNWNGIIAFAVGVVGATICFSKAPPPVNFPFHWMTPISNHFGSACAGTPVKGVCNAGWLGGADFSVPVGIILGALVYFILEKMNGNVAAQVERQNELETSK